jgi:predicted small integral membrane protein
MGRLIKVVLVLAVLGFAGLVGYAYLADLAPVSAEVKVPVILDAD